MGGFRKLKLSAIATGRATSQALWRQVRNNFESHESRISDLEDAPPVLPTGAIAKFGGAVAPTGWLLCQGQVVSRTTYADLFAIMGTAYNTGGEAGTDFRLPDGRGRTLIASGTGSGLSARARGDYVGEETHQLTTAEMPSHVHVLTDPGHSHTGVTRTVTAGGALTAHNITNGTAVIPPTRVTNSQTTGVTLASTGGDGAHNNMQPSLVVNWIVKT